MSGALPEKWLWTDEDFEQMPFGDTFIHGIGFDGGALLLDIDYMACWEPDRQNEGCYKALLAPATLRFNDVLDVEMELSPCDGLIILDLLRGESGRRPDEGRDWMWEIDEISSRGIRFRATGFQLFIRRPPKRCTEFPACLSTRERGGISFICETFKEQKASRSFQRSCRLTLTCPRRGQRN